MVHLAALVVLWLGVAVFALSCLAVTVFPDVWSKIHGLAPSSIGAVLVGIAIAIQEGPGHTGGTVAVTVFLLFVSAPIITTATARAAHVRQREENPDPSDGGAS